MMRIWLDDVRPMPEGFDYHAKTADEAIRKIIECGCADFVSFDHDLGDDRNGTGYHVALWIEEQAYNNIRRVKRWRVHSANPVGARNIHAAMLSAGRRVATCRGAAGT